MNFGIGISFGNNRKRRNNNFIEPEVAMAIPVYDNNFERTVICPKCKGNGFVHDSNMNHSKHSSRKCFFCTECKTCDSRGVIQVRGNRPDYCFRCKGNGFIHNSNMNHSKSFNKRCFFCEDCVACGGKGI